MRRVRLQRVGPEGKVRLGSVLETTREQDAAVEAACLELGGATVEVRPGRLGSISLYREIVGEPVLLRRVGPDGEPACYCGRTSPEVEDRGGYGVLCEYCYDLILGYR